MDIIKRCTGTANMIKALIAARNLNFPVYAYIKRFPHAPFFSNRDEYSTLHCCYKTTDEAIKSLTKGRIAHRSQSEFKWIMYNAVDETTEFEYILTVKGDD